MKSFIELNIKAKNKIVKKFKKYTKFSNNSVNVEKMENFCFNELKEKLKDIVTLITDIEKKFLKHFINKYGFRSNKILKEYISPIIFTELQTFYFGFTVGFMIILGVLCIIIAHYFNIDMDDDKNFKQIFPMFR